MSDIDSRKLVVKRHPKAKHLLILCDEETGLPLSGQTSLTLENNEGEAARLIVIFEAFGQNGVRFEDDPRQI